MKYAYVGPSIVSISSTVTHSRIRLMYNSLSQLYRVQGVLEMGKYISITISDTVARSNTVPMYVAIEMGPQKIVQIHPSPTMFYDTFIHLDIWPALMPRKYILVTRLVYSLHVYINTSRFASLRLVEGW